MRQNSDSCSLVKTVSVDLICFRSVQGNISLLEDLGIILFESVINDNADTYADSPVLVRQRNMS